MDDAGEVERGNLNILHIRIEEFEEVVRHSGLLRVLHTNPELVRIGRGEIKSEVVIVPHGLDQLEKVDHVHSENMLGRAVIGLETVRVQAEIDEYSVGLIDRHHLDALRVEFQVSLRQNLL